MTINNAKYPRTLHMSFSPGKSSDDKVSNSLSNFLNKQVVITEKLDGGNACLNKQGVFARSHSSSASHPSFHWLKSEHARVYDILNSHSELDFFGEYCYAVHSIKYHQLSSFFFLFGIRDSNSKSWKSWDQIVEFSKKINFPTVPELFRGSFKSEKELEEKVLELCNSQSFFGGDREGVVLRVCSEFDNDNFENSVVKWVRKDHVQTDQHWSTLPIVKQKVKK